jgi:UDP-3-O-[3-hydroxymyristoyl] glucosamine N-acyltransferase
VAVGDFVMMGGQTGIADNVTIGSGAQLAGQTGATTNVPSGVRWGGTPGQPARNWMREVSALHRLARRGGWADGEGE